MLRYFRQLRRKLMEQNKIRTYILYAVGEIALVMIGILLALQVNNWNQQRLADIKAVSYHERIIEDLDIFISETRNSMGRSTRIRNMILETVELLESKKLPEDKIQLFDRTLHLYYQIPYRNPSLTTLTEMRSNGELNLIRNLELRKKLIKMEQEILSTDQILVSIGNHTEEPVFYVDQYVRSIPDTSSIRVNYIEVSVKADFNAMANDEKLINYFSKFAVQWSHHLIFSLGLNEMAIELRDALMLELESLQ